MSTKFGHNENDAGNAKQYTYIPHEAVFIFQGHALWVHGPDNDVATFVLCV